MKISIISLVTCIVYVAAEGNAPKVSSPIGKCVMNMDCDDDDQCAGGLLCADDHKAELKAAGFDTRTADCGMTSVDPYWEVCFDPCILSGSCPSGSGMGDPHFQTYDGTPYSFHGECDLIMARSAEFDSGLGLDVHVRTTMIDDWSLISHAAIRIGDDVFEVVNDRKHFLNGAKDVELPVTLAGKYTVSKAQHMVEYPDPEGGTVSDHVDEYTIILGRGKIKITNFKSMLTVNVESYLPGVEGMLGVQGIAGMVGRDRTTVLDDGNVMGAEWQVRDTEAMLFNDIREPQYPAACTVPSVSTRRLRAVDDAEKKVADNACADVLSSLRKFCVEDVLRSGDVSLAIGYKAAGKAISH